MTIAWFVFWSLMVVLSCLSFVHPELLWVVVPVLVVAVVIFDWRAPS